MAGSTVVISVKGGVVQWIYASRRLLRYSDFLLIDWDGEQIGDTTEAIFFGALPLDQMPDDERQLMLEAYERKTQ